jgi:hypothetical protein
MCLAEVVNGQSTKLLVKILNTSGTNVTLVDIAGSYHDVDTGKTLRNVSLYTKPVYMRLICLDFRSPRVNSTFLSLKA